MSWCGSMPGLSRAPWDSTCWSSSCLPTPHTPGSRDLSGPQSANSSGGKRPLLTTSPCDQKTDHQQTPAWIPSKAARFPCGSWLPTETRCSDRTPAASAPGLANTTSPRHNGQTPPEAHYDHAGAAPSLCPSTADAARGASAPRVRWWRWWCTSPSPARRTLRRRRSPAWGPRRS
jgi:hypothetical protein